jgi:hypothetical protein
MAQGMEERRAKLRGCRRGSSAAAARLSGGLAEGAKGPLGGWGNLGGEEGGTYSGQNEGLGGIARMFC